MKYRGTQHCIGKNTKYRNIPPSPFVGGPDGAKINIK